MDMVKRRCPAVLDTRTASSANTYENREWNICHTMRDLESPQRGRLHTHLCKQASKTKSGGNAAGISPSRCRLFDLAG